MYASSVFFSEVHIWWIVAFSSMILVLSACVGYNFARKLTQKDGLGTVRNFFMTVVLLLSPFLTNSKNSWLVWESLFVIKTAFWRRTANNITDFINYAICSHIMLSI